MGVAGSRGRCRTSRSTDSRAGTRHGGYGRFCAVYASVALQGMKGPRASAKGSEPHCAEMCEARCDDGDEDGDGARKSRAQGATPNGRGRTKGRKGAGKMMERTAVGGEGTNHIWKGETHRNEPRDTPLQGRVHVIHVMEGSSSATGSSAYNECAQSGRDRRRSPRERWKRRYSFTNLCARASRVDEETNRSFRRLHAGHFTHSVAWANCAPLAVAKALGMGIGQGDPSGARRGNANATQCTSCSSEGPMRKERCRAAVKLLAAVASVLAPDPSSSADDARTAERAHGLAEEDQL